MRRLIRHREATVLVLGQSFSSVGTSALWLALGIWINELTGSASAAGLSFFMYALGTLTGPVGGEVTDRVGRRRLLIVVNLASVLLVLPLLAVRDAADVWLAYTVMFFYGVSTGVIAPAQAALLQGVLPADLLGEANGVLQTIQQGTRIVTPLAGAALLAAVGPWPLIVGDAFTFLVAALSLVALRNRERRPLVRRDRWLVEATAGMRHIRRVPAIREVLAASVLAFVGFGFAETALFLVVREGLGRPSTFVGVLVAAQGAGAIFAGVTGSWLIRRAGERQLVAAALAANGTGFLMLCLTSTITTLIGCVLLGVSLPWINIGTITLFQRLTPARLMGRTYAAFTLLTTTPQTVAIALGAVLMANIDYRVLLVLIAAAAAAAGVALFLKVTPVPERSDSARTQPAPARPRHGT